MPNQLAGARIHYWLVSYRRRALHCVHWHERKEDNCQEYAMSFI